MNPILLSACVLAVALSLLAAVYDRLPGDLAVSRELQGWGALDAIAQPVRLLGDVRLLAPVGLLLAVALWWTGERRAALMVAIAMIAMQPAQVAVKEVVERPRPAPPLVEVRGGGSSPSFPAGHVFSPVLAFGAAGAVAVHLRPRWAVRAAVLTGVAGSALIAGAVNVYLGVHWPSDCLGGVVWAGVLLAGAGVISSRLQLNRDLKGYEQD